MGRITDQLISGNHPAWAITNAANELKHYYGSTRKDDTTTETLLRSYAEKVREELTKLDAILAELE